MIPYRRGRSCRLLCRGSLSCTIERVVPPYREGAVVDP